MGKIKVLQVNKLYYPHTGGIEKVVQQLAEGLKDRTDMEVLVCRTRGRTRTDQVNGVTVRRAGSIGVLFSLPISLPFLWQLRRMSKDRDVLHFHMPFPLGDIGCLLSGYQGKVVVWWHSDVVRQKLLMKLYRPTMERFLKRADVIIVATQGHIDGSDYLSNYKEKCVIIPFGVDQEIERKADEYIRTVQTQLSQGQTTPQPEQQLSPRQELHPSLQPTLRSNPQLTLQPGQLPGLQAKVQFLFVGRLVYYKGCDVLIEAFRKVRGAELTVIGSGGLDGELKRQAREYGLADTVHFLGNVDDEQLSKAFAGCDVFVLPSVVKSEAFGLVQIEAMAYGKPVINTRLPSGVPYVSLDHITGLTVEPGDADALAKAMQWMVDHEEERGEMGRKARDRVKECYRMEDMLEQVLKVYER